MTKTQDDKASIIAEYRTHERDCGSSEVQIAVLTSRIRELTEHLKVHKKDHATRRGLLKLVGRRSSLLRYVRDRDVAQYEQLIQRLEIRGIRSDV